MARLDNLRSPQVGQHQRSNRPKSCFTVVKNHATWLLSSLISSVPSSTNGLPAKLPAKQFQQPDRWSEVRSRKSSCTARC